MNHGALQAPPARSLTASRRSAYSAGQRAKSHPGAWARSRCSSRTAAVGKGAGMSAWSRAYPRRSEGKCLLRHPTAVVRAESALAGVTAAFKGCETAHQALGRRFRGTGRTFCGLGGDGVRTTIQPLRRCPEAEGEKRYRGDGLDQTPNSGRRLANWFWSRWTIALCIWLTRLSERSSVAPISFIVSSS